MGLLVADTSPDQIASIANEYFDSYWLGNESRFRKSEDLEDSWPTIQRDFLNWWKSQESWMVEDFGDNSQEMDIDLTLYLASEKALKLLHEKTKHLFGISEVVHSRLNYVLKPLQFLGTITGITALSALLARRKEATQRKAFDDRIKDDGDEALAHEPADIEDFDEEEILWDQGESVVERDDVYESGEGPDEVVIIGPPLHDAFVRAREED